MRDQRLPDHTELTPFEAQLAPLAPRAGIDRDRLMFAAGRQFAARRVRVANGLLAASGVLWCCLALSMVVAPRWAQERPASPAPQAMEAGGLAKDEHPAEPLPHAERATSDAVSSAVAALDGPTNFRLLQILGNDPSAAIDVHTESDNPVDSAGEIPAPSYPRVLLNRYLESMSQRM